MVACTCALSIGIESGSRAASRPAAAGCSRIVTRIRCCTRWKVHERRGARRTQAVCTVVSSGVMDETLRSLFPESEPWDSGRLAVQPPHELYYEQYGNPNGKPA